MPLSESFQLRLTAPQKAGLEEISRVTDLGKAELIRRAVDNYLEVFRREQDAAHKRAADQVITTIVPEPAAFAAVQPRQPRQLPKIARR